MEKTTKSSCLIGAKDFVETEKIAIHLVASNKHLENHPSRGTMDSMGYVVIFRFFVIIGVID